jgi:RNase H-fold protein (predicted Holliday junction resolvase)
MRGSFQAGCLEAQDATRNKTDDVVDKLAKQVIMAGFFGAKQLASTRTERKKKLTGC